MKYIRGTSDNHGIGTKAYVAVLICLKSFFRNFDRKYEGIVKYPAVTRDISIGIVPREILVGQIEAVIAQRGGKILESYALFDIL